MREFNPPVGTYFLCYKNHSMIVCASGVRFLLAILVLVLPPWVPTEAQVNLRYQDRIGYHEGVRGNAVAGERIDLVFAMVSYQEQASILPPQLKLYFYLPKGSQKNAVFPVVRERKQKTYYRLDQVSNPGRWRQNNWNAFEWPTDKVINPLQERNNLEWQQLVALVRLEKDYPRQREVVAPVILYHRKLPSRVEDYVFGFKCNFKSVARCELYRQGEEKPLKTQFPLIDPGELSTTAWKIDNVQSGMYEMRITASASNLSIEKVIVFYHHPRIQ